MTAELGTTGGRMQIEPLAIAIGALNRMADANRYSAWWLPDDFRREARRALAAIALAATKPEPVEPEGETPDVVE